MRARHAAVKAQYMLAKARIAPGRPRPAEGAELTVRNTLIKLITY